MFLRFAWIKWNILFVSPIQRTLFLLQIEASNSASTASAVGSQNQSASKIPETSASSRAEPSRSRSRSRSDSRRQRSSRERDRPPHSRHHSDSHHLHERRRSRSRSRSRDRHRRSERFERERDREDSSRNICRYVDAVKTSGGRGGKRALPYDRPSPPPGNSGGLNEALEGAKQQLSSQMASGGRLPTPKVWPLLEH